MREIRVTFQIGNEDYALYVRKGMRRFKVYLFRECGGKILEPMPVKEASASTASEELKHCWMLLTSYFRKKVKGERRKLYISKEAWEDMEKRLADLERKVQGQPSPEATANQLKEMLLAQISQHSSGDSSKSERR